MGEMVLTTLLFLRIVTVIAAIYMAASTWAFYHDAETKEICPYRVICATTWPQMILLTFSRLFAGALFAALTFTVLSKCYATKAFLHHSWLGAVFDAESHDIHTYFGYLTLAAGMEHGALHVIRYAIRGETDLLYTTNTGRSGVICTLLLLPVVLPMKYQWFKDRMKFDARKMMHALFLPVLIGLCFHSYVFRYVGSILIVWYLVDRFFFTTKQMFLIEHPAFEAVGRGTMVGLDLPPGYRFKAGSFVFVNCPAISKFEWHPFTIFPVSGSDSTAGFYAEAIGDWTRELFRLGLEQPRLPLWITAAQPSTMDKAVYYKRLILICTGAGITPGISIAQRYCDKKDIHLLWITRDCGMVALFEKQLHLVCSTVYLTGEPETEAKLALTKLLAPRAPEDDVDMSNWSVGTSRTGTEASLRTMRRPALLQRSRASLMNPGVPGTPGRPRSPSFSRPTLQVHGEEHRATKFDEPTASTDQQGGGGVKLMFGRPDIKSYLTDIFEGENCSHADQEAGITTAPGDHTLNVRQSSVRLSRRQQKSKAILLAADKKTVESTKGIESGDDGDGDEKDPSKDAAADVTVSDSIAVLYCGANQKVEAVIESTCVEKNVHWKKEYFGAW